MKIIDATWEKRNLGVTCYKIDFSNEDKISDIESSRDKFFERQFIVFRVPNNRTDIAAYVQSQGAKYVETLITFQCDLRNWKLPDSLKELCAMSSYALMNDDDVKVMLDEVQKGMFHKADYVYFDPYFTHEQATNRFVNWAMDLLKRDVPFYKVMYRGETIGFFNKEFAGVYSKFLRTGMGLFVQYACTDIAKKAAWNKVSSVVSVHNLDVMNIRIKLGYQIKSINYIFVMHND